MLMAERLFTKNASPDSQKSFAKDVVKRQQYFATKAQLATNIKQAALALEALKELSSDSQPFLSYSGKNGVFNFVDYLGESVSQFPASADDIKVVKLIDYHMKTTVLETGQYSVSNGQLTVKAEGLSGRQWLQIETSKGMVKCAESMLTGARVKNTITQVSFKSKNDSGLVDKKKGLPIK